MPDDIHVAQGPMAEIDRAFYDLVVSERDYERTRALKAESELRECKSRLRIALMKTGELGIGALLADDSWGLSGEH
jgi:hypothetical protein